MNKLFTRIDIVFLPVNDFDRTVHPEPNPKSFGFRDLDGNLLAVCNWV